MKEAVLFAGGGKGADAYVLSLTGSGSFADFEKGVSAFLHESEQGRALWDNTEGYVTIANLYPWRSELSHYTLAQGIAQLGIFRLPNFPETVRQPDSHIKPLLLGIGNGRRPQQF